MFAIAHASLVSPVAPTASEHVFFVRAGLPAPPPSVFETDEGERVPVVFCPWLGSSLALPERIFALAQQALGGVAPALRQMESLRTTLLTNVQAGRVADDALDAMVRDLAHGLGARVGRTTTGEAGSFTALGEVEAIFAHDEADVVVLLGVDSLVSIDVLERELDDAPSPWAAARLPAAEGAAALVLVSERHARELAIKPIGRIVHSDVILGRSNDDNDEPVDGAALTALLHRLPTSRPFPIVAGQMDVGQLRFDEFHFAALRNRTRFEPECDYVCVERWTGRVGAATAPMNIAHVLTAVRHGALGALESMPFLAWAISPDGTRGVALCEAGAR